LILPEYFRAGAAWGEWGPEEIKVLIGYIPKGLEKLASFWSAPMPDYAFKDWNGKGLGALSFAYIGSAILGIAIIIGLSFLIGKFLGKKE
jgi:hypothetical protein